MSVKPLPAQLPTWDTSLLNTIALTGIHKTNGFANSEAPTSAEANTLFAFLYLWAQYLSDGAFSGVSSFDNTLAVTGVVTATAGVVAGINSNVTLSGTGFYKRGVKVRKIPVCLGSSSTSSPTTQWSATAAAQSISFPIELTEGERLLSVTARTASFGAADVLTLKMFQAQPTIFSAVQLGATATSVGHASVLEALVVSGLTEIASSANNYNYLCTVTATGFTSGSAVYGLEITTDVP